MPDSLGHNSRTTSEGWPASALDVPISVTVFPNHGAAAKIEYRLSLRKLVPHLTDTRAATKGQLPWLKLATFGAQRTDKNSLRHDANVLEVYGIEADYDGEQITVERARQIIGNAGLAAIIYTSPSHTAATPRWRVLCPLSAPVAPEQRAPMLARLNGLFVGALAGESFTLSQSYYFGAVDGAPDHTVIAIDGRAIDDAPELDADAIGRPKPPKAEQQQAAPLVALPPIEQQPGALVRVADGTAYGLRALAYECQAIREAPDGAKHLTLNKAAYSIGGLVAAGEIEREFAKVQLLAALQSIQARCENFGAALRTLETAFADGLAAPRSKPEMAQPPPKLEARSDGRAASPLPLIYFDDAQPNLDASDFVEGVLTAGAMSVIYGPSNCGKTFFATDLGLHVAAGKPWRGREVDAGGVIYCALEGSHGISNRVTAWRGENYLDGANIPFAIVPVSINLLDPDADRQKLVDTIAIAAAELGVAVSLVVIDTLSRAMAGGNENAPDDMGALVNSADFIRQATGAHVMFIHHSGKDDAKGARGHSLLRAATDTEIEISRADSQAPSFARVTKQREMEIDGEFGFKLKAVELGTNRRGKPVTSCVVEIYEPSQTQPDKQDVRQMSGDVRRAWEILNDVCAAQGIQNAAGIPPNVVSVPEAWWRDAFYSRAKPGAADAAKQKAFRRAADFLVEKHMVGVGAGRVWPC